MSDATPAPQLAYCCHDGQLTREPVAVDEVHSSSGAGTHVYACPRHAHLYSGTQRGPRLGAEHFG
ncbi:hypothetical protein [Streptomyces sp. NBC_00154]|uniref:hypothetical protein n=1 Tax=Streptomyces sp. NBC_00154 TaxID=2975670 RepID=UPI00224EE687|nr:hypothetical protein [Streptomyces sp. NBC_00154]MCX5309412.1 hypothetical protein [Streptomyces sp. NBC_00154]